MYNLIIADDEYIIRESLASFVDWQSLGFSVQLVAKDGDEVIAALKSRSDIQVILSDIQMREVSGLDVAQYVSTHCPEITMVIISGYREFEYARKAIDYNVSHYLLKPIDIASITKVFEKIKEELDAKQQRQLQQKRQQENLYQVKRAAREKFFELAYLGLFTTKLDICFYLKQFGLYDDLFSLQCHELLLEIQEMSNYELLAKEIFQNILAMIIPTHHLRYTPVVLSDGENRYRILLLSPEPLSKVRLEAFCKDVVNAIQDVCASGAKVVLQREALSLLDFVLSLPTMPQKSSEEEYLTAMAHQYLLILKMTTEIQSTTEILGRIFTDFTANADASTKQRLEQRLFSHLSTLLAPQMPQIPQILEAKKQESFSERLCLLHQAVWEYENSCLSAVDTVKALVAGRVTENITLQQAADSVYISPNYLSRLFKDETGENFSDYTIRIKMEKAAELLRRPEQKVYEIGEYLGYKSLQYFYKLFKRIYGITPSEYREQALKNGEEH